MAVGLPFGFGDPDEDTERIHWCAIDGCDRYRPCCIDGYEEIGFCLEDMDFVTEQQREDGSCVW